ncbi:MAG: hypothetical protein JXB88_00565 [Spirochaetales bacterium]|nr:hypothetical protein [Spirochaetales bacterium]
MSLIKNHTSAYTQTTSAHIHPIRLMNNPYTKIKVAAICVVSTAMMSTIHLP